MKVMEELQAMVDHFKGDPAFFKPWIDALQEVITSWISKDEAAEWVLDNYDPADLYGDAYIMEGL